MHKDPFERHNLVYSTDHRDIRDQLRGYIIQHIEKNEDEMAENLTHALKLGR